MRLAEPPTAHWTWERSCTLDLERLRAWTPAANKRRRSSSWKPFPPCAHRNATTSRQSFPRVSAAAKKQNATTLATASILLHFHTAANPCRQHPSLPLFLPAAPCRWVVRPSFASLVHFGLGSRRFGHGAFGRFGARPEYKQGLPWALPCLRLAEPGRKPHARNPREA